MKQTSPDWPMPVIGSMPITCSQLELRMAAGSRVLASLGVDTITARAPLSSRICWWSRSVLVM
jgi:hypothetical protein